MSPCLLVFSLLFLIVCIAVPQQQSSMGSSQQIVSKQDTETKIEVVKPSDCDESNSQASNSEDSTETCCTKGREQQKESEVVSVLLTYISSVTVKRNDTLSAVAIATISAPVSFCQNIKDPHLQLLK